MPSLSHAFFDPVIRATVWRRNHYIDILSETGRRRKYTLNPGGESVTEGWTHITDTIVDGLTVDASDNIIAVGTLFVEGLGHEVYVLKLDREGDAEWTELYGTGAVSEDPEGPREAVPATRQPLDLWESLPGYEDCGYAVAVDATGNIFITGYMGGFETGTGHTSQK